MLGKNRKLELLTLSISGSHVCYLRRTSKRRVRLGQTEYDWIYSLTQSGNATLQTLFTRVTQELALPDLFYQI